MEGPLGRRPTALGDSVHHDEDPAVMAVVKPMIEEDDVVALR
jgi:hypothetical protein